MTKELTERKQAEKKLLEQAQILEQVHDIVICTDLNGYILSWNRGAEKVYGYSTEESLGRPDRFSALSALKKDSSKSRCCKSVMMSNQYHHTNIFSNVII